MDIETASAVASATPPPPANPRRQFGWVPVRSLAERHRPRILAHLQELSATDRYLRFGHPASDEQLAAYVDRLDFERDEVFGIFNRRLELLALAHLAYGPEVDSGTAAAEFGVSVMGKARGRGFGGRLFEHAVLHARNRHIDTMIIHALSENAAMLRIVRKAGATVVRDRGESEARLELPPEDLASHLGQMVGQQAAELDYRWKSGTRAVGDLIELIGELREDLTRNGGGGSGSQ